MYNDDEIRICIEKIIRNAPDFNLDIEVDSYGKWFLIHNMPLSSAFSESCTEIIVKFENNNNAVVLVPASLKINHKAVCNICPLVLTEHVYLPTWRQVCPFLVSRTLETCLENIAVILEFVTNPTLCGMQGCDQRSSYERALADF